MLSIGHFSNICQVSIKTLHHYDKIDLMAPSFIDEFTGYRYYNEDQIPTMLLIQRLKRYGFSLSEIKDVLLEGNTRVLFSKLETQKGTLLKQMEETALIVKEMERHLNDFERTGNIMGYQNNYTIQLKETSDITIISSRQKMSVEDFGTFYGKLFETVGKEHLTVTGTVLAIYHDEEFDPDCSDIELAVSIAEKEKATRTLPGTLCATTIHRGGYSSLADGYGAIMKWIDQNGYEIIDCPYEKYLKNQFNQLPVDEWETEISFPVKKK